MRSENVYVECEIELANGRTIEVTDYVKDVIITYSLNFAIPQVSIVFDEIVNTHIRTDIKTVNLQIDFYKYHKSVVHTDKYTLIPQTFKTKLHLPAMDLEGKNSSPGNITRNSLSFYIKSCYDAVNYTTPDVLKFNTTIENLLNEIKPSNCSIILNSDLNSKTIPQIYIRKQPFLSAVNYISLYFGLSYGPTCRSIVPSEDSTDKCNLLISDIRQVMVDGEMYDKTFLVRISKKSDMEDIKNELQGDRFVIDYPVNFTSMTVPPCKYTVVVKPYKQLFKTFTFNEEELINSVGAIYKTYDRKRENVGDKQEKHEIIVNHSGFDLDPIPISSMLVYEYMFNSRSTIRLEEIPHFHFIWPGEIINLKIDHPDHIVHSGLYVTESILYRLTKEKSRTWQMSSELTVVRSNLYFTSDNSSSINIFKEPESNEPQLGSQHKQNITDTLQNFEPQVNQKIQDIQNKISDMESETNQRRQDTQTLLNSISSVTSNNPGNDFENIQNDIQDIQNLNTQSDILDKISNIKQSLENIKTLVLNTKNLIQTVKNNIDLSNIQNLESNLSSSIQDSINTTSEFKQKTKSVSKFLDQANSSKSELFKRLTEFTRSSWHNLSVFKKYLSQYSFYNILSRFYSILEDYERRISTFSISPIENMIEILDDTISNYSPFQNDQPDINFLKSIVNKNIDINLLNSMKLEIFQTLYEKTENVQNEIDKYHYIITDGFNIIQNKLTEEVNNVNEIKSNISSLL